MCPSDNSSNPVNFIAGSLCMDRRNFAFFNNRNTTNPSIMKAEIHSSPGPNMTIEMWIKD